MLRDAESAQRIVFDGYRRMLAIRTRQPAFHPAADHGVLDTPHKSLVAFTRTGTNGDQQILVAANTAEQPVTLDLSTYPLVRAMVTSLVVSLACASG